MLARHSKSFLASMATIVLMGCSVVLIALGFHRVAVILWGIGTVLYVPFLRRIWVVFVLALVFGSCVVRVPVKVEQTTPVPPTLAEKQAMYHANNKHPLKDKRIPVVVFWGITGFILTYAAISGMVR
jgi:hypothetical protein